MIITLTTHLLWQLNHLSQYSKHSYKKKDNFLTINKFLQHEVNLLYMCNSDEGFHPN